jgi:hypothetical protein
MALSQTKAITTPVPTITGNMLSQPKACTSQPISGAKITVAKYCAELNRAEATPRSCVRNQLDATRLLPGVERAAAAPVMKPAMPIGYVSGP